MLNTALYKGKAVTVKPCPVKEFETLVLDAKRIMGLAPSLHDRITLLEPPSENSDTWNYAKRILGLEWPVVKIWVGYPLVVSLSELQYD